MATKKAAAKPKAKTKAKAKPKAKTKAAPKPAKRAPVVKGKMTKTQMLSAIADSSGVAKKDVAAVLNELEALIEGSVGKRAVGEFTLPGLLKITTVKKPARKARKGINPFTGEQTVFKAKPASIAVKVRPLKKLKDYAAK